ncbi:hypothetical protein ACI2L4_06465 [Streptomyces sparsogenes]|uniref:hypothetical protein n=1 Tax=Streptomyces sparsogenes TaxID=67365 RepID=UPI0033FFAA66
MSIQATHQSTTATPDLLRTSLRVDSWATAAFGAVMLAGAKWLRDPLGLPVALSVVFGIVMLAGGAVLALIARYPRIPVRAAAAVVVVNSLSCLGMVALACTDVVELTGLGRAFMVVGAVAVAVFGEFEFVGLRRVRRMSGRPA